MRTTCGALVLALVAVSAWGQPAGDGDPAGSATADKASRLDQKAAANATTNAPASRPRVSLCGERAGLGASTFMIFDLDGAILPAEKGAVTVVLTAPSEALQAGTATLPAGDFIVAPPAQGDAAPKATTYGSTGYSTVDGFRAPVFFLRGDEQLGCTKVPSGLWLTGSAGSTRIGEVGYPGVVGPDGIQMRMHRLGGSSGKWTAGLGDKVMQLEPDGKLAQVGWVGWRRVTTPQGEPVILLMTKSMAKDDVWAGRYDGKWYVEKPPDPSPDAKRVSRPR
jgi:hypothetical protein